MESYAPTFLSIEQGDDGNLSGTHHLVKSRDGPLRLRHQPTQPESRRESSIIWEANFQTSRLNGQIASAIAFPRRMDGRRVPWSQPHFRIDVDRGADFRCISLPGQAQPVPQAPEAHCRSPSPPTTSVCRDRTLSLVSWSNCSSIGFMTA